MAGLRPVDDDQRLAVLQRWRDDLINSGAVSRSSFKEAHLRLVLRSGRTDAEQIRGMLPGTVAQHAEEMSAILRQLPRSERDETVSPDITKDDAAAPASVPQTGFVRYKFGTTQQEVAAVSLRRVRGSDAQETALEVSWPPFVTTGGDSPECIIYRLVSTDGDRGYSPDNAHLIEATSTTRATDGRGLDGAVRHLQVWVNAGASSAEALAAQPVLHADGAVICTLRDFEIREDSGTVIGKWTAVPGVSAVRVYRIPAELAGHDGPAFQIATSQPNLTGFIDHDVEPGRRYVYRMRCQVEVDSVMRLSEAVESEIQIAPVLEPVTDLTLTTHGKRDSVAIDLAWTAPRFGQVMIFRTPESPSADAHDIELDQSVLDQVGLSRDAQLIRPVFERGDEHDVCKSVMPAVPWPDDWSRAYFTPVTVLDGRAKLGKSISTVRIGRITDVSLMEYCDRQVLTFDWPDGAATVMVYIAPRGHDPSRGLTGRYYPIARADYEKYGGMQFVDRLPNGGCSLHLVPVAFSAGRQVQGVPKSIEYSGLLRMWYDVNILRDRAGLPLSAALRIRAETETTGSPPFVLVNNPKRIPLSVKDGWAVDVFQIDDKGEPVSGRAKEFQWSALTTAEGDTESEVWVGDVRGLRGWVRLFANLPPQRSRLLALLDPPVDALRLTPGPMSQ